MVTRVIELPARKIWNRKNYQEKIVKS